MKVKLLFKGRQRRQDQLRAPHLPRLRPSHRPALLATGHMELPSAGPTGGEAVHGRRQLHPAARRGSVSHLEEDSLVLPEEASQGSPDPGGKEEQVVT